ncbi:MAG: hypothetical protein IKR14_07180 [Lachnospiraceae bacterium]|nr:hypothetical protein [Lachnospiraceae bacterium]
MDGFFTQMIAPTTMTERKRDNRKRQNNQRQNSESKKESESRSESYGAVYIHTEPEITPVTYKKPKSH